MKLYAKTNRAVPNDLQQKILIRLKRRDPVTQIAQDYRVSIPYIYKLKRERAEDLAALVNDHLADTGMGEVLEQSIDSKREKLDTSLCQCVNWDYDGKNNLAARHDFERYRGEENKYLCSYKCYVEYSKRNLKPASEQARFKDTPFYQKWKTSEFQEAILEKAYPFFRDEITADESAAEQQHAE